MVIARSSLFLFFFAFLAPGCAPECKSVCRKLIDCGVDGSGVVFDECRQSCESQQALLEGWADELKVEAFDEHRRCIGRSSCEEIAAEECYDPEVFSF